MSGSPNSGNECPICKRRYGVGASDLLGGQVKIDCPNCGGFAFIERTITNVRQRLTGRELAVLSFAIRKMQRVGEILVLDDDLVQHVTKKDYLPSPDEFIDNLLLHMASIVVEPGHIVSLHADDLRATIGAIEMRGAFWTIQNANEQGLISGDFFTDGGSLRETTLTPAGWRRVRELRSVSSAVRLAFMAMPFGNEELDSIFRKHFKRATERAGFELFRLDERQRAGSIDDRLRVDIRRCRFLIADLTHGNKGVYWEAGFAEGIGRPVIYTCRKDVFDDKDRKPHFDTNHHLTILWNSANLQTAEDELAATIRATLPAEAKLNDD